MFSFWLQWISINLKCLEFQDIKFPVLSFSFRFQTCQVAIEVEREEDEGGMVGETFTDYVIVFILLVYAFAFQPFSTFTYLRRKPFSTSTWIFWFYEKLRKDSLNVYFSNLNSIYIPCSGLQSCQWVLLIQILLWRHHPCLQYSLLNLLILLQSKMIWKIQKHCRVCRLRRWFMPVRLLFS